MGAEEGRGMEEVEAHWVGTVLTSLANAGDVDKSLLQLVLLAMDCMAFFINDGMRDAHCMGFCKQVLWQAFHHVNLHDMRHPAFSINPDSTTARLTQNGTLHDVHGGLWDQRQVGHWYKAFRIVNGTFAAEVARMVCPDNVVWVHD